MHRKGRIQKKGGSRTKYVHGCRLCFWAGQSIFKTDFSAQTRLACTETQSDEAIIGWRKSADQLFSFRRTTLHFTQKTDMLKE